MGLEKLSGHFLKKSSLVLLVFFIQTACKKQGSGVQPRQVSPKPLFEDAKGVGSEQEAHDQQGQEAEEDYPGDNYAKRLNKIDDLKMLQDILQKQKEKLSSYAGVLFSLIDGFEAGFQKCLDEGVEDTPYLTTDDIEILRAVGIAGIEEALHKLESPLYTRVENPKFGKGQGESTPWYSDQTAWGVFNLVSGLLVVAGALSTQVEPKFDVDSTIQDEYRLWRKKNQKAKMEDFDLFLKQDNPELHKKFNDQFDIKKYNSSLKKGRLLKYGTLAGGGILIGVGVLMTAVGQSTMLTESEQCPANPIFKKGLEKLFFDVKDTKLEIRITQLKINGFQSR